MGAARGDEQKTAVFLQDLDDTIDGGGLTAFKF